MRESLVSMAPSLAAERPARPGPRTSTVLRVTEVRAATRDDIDRLGRIAAAGFYDDPVMAWAFPDPAVRLDRLVFMFTGLAADMVPDRGVVHLVDDATASFWRDPHFDHAGNRGGDDGRPMPYTDDELERLIVLGAAIHEHHPAEPHWYLNVLGTVPDRQGQGLGAAVIRPVLDRCDADGARAYLESSNPRNLPFYRRHGFEDAGEIRLEGGPSMTRMWREPRSG
jgi:GNAT superfamily N-acetyltransferase